MNTTILDAISPDEQCVETIAKYPWQLEEFIKSNFVYRGIALKRSWTHN